MHSSSKSYNLTVPQPYLMPNYFCYLRLCMSLQIQIVHRGLYMPFPGLLQTPFLVNAFGALVMGR